MDTINEFDSVQTLVLELLRSEERCRNDDKWLTYRVMQHYTNIYIKFSDFDKMPAFETIKRVRAKIQNESRLFLPTDPKILAKRQKKPEDVKEWLKNTK